MTLDIGTWGTKRDLGKGVHSSGSINGTGAGRLRGGFLQGQGQGTLVA